MTRQEEQIKIAELDGFHNIITFNLASGKKPIGYEDKELRKIRAIPNYHVDYNAIRNVIIKLDDVQKYDYMVHLKLVIGTKNFCDLLCATTEQMAKALATI